MHQFVSVKLRCPLCGLEFVADEAHGAWPVGHETDFRPLYEGLDPTPSLIHACPSCRYSGYREAFGTERSDEDELIDPREEDERSLPRPPFESIPDADLPDLRRYARSGELWRNYVHGTKEPFGTIRYILAGRVHEFRHEQDPLGSAHYLLRAAWCSRAIGDRKMERETLRGVLIRLAGVLEGDRQVPSSRRPSLVYLSGELARRVGNFAMSLEYFAQLEQLADPDDDEGALLLALARRQSRLSAVKSAVNAVIPAALTGRRSDADAMPDQDEEEEILLATGTELPIDDEDDDDSPGGGLN